MIFFFSESCVVKIINCPKSISNFLIHENIINHAVNNSSKTHNVQVEFKELKPYKALQKLHPNACVTDLGFAFHDKNNRLVFPDYNYKEVINILVDVKIDPTFFWDILFDHIKLLLLKNNIVTLHAAGLEKNNFAKLFFGWDGTGKSSLLIDSIQNGSTYLGDDRIFIDINGSVFPFFNPIKQFHHELLSYPTLLNELNFFKRFFIILSQKIETIPSKHIFFKKIGRLFLKIFRKFNLNYVVINSTDYGQVYNKSFNLDKVFIVNKTSKNSLEEINLTNIIKRISSNVVYADIEMIKRYNTALYSGEISDVECLEQMNKYVFNILSKTLSKFKFEVININRDTKINRHLWEN